MNNNLIRVGDSLPAFNLHDQNNKIVKLAGINNKKVLLSFHPLAWTKICSEQMKSIEKNINSFEKFNVIPFGFSVDSVPCKKEWAKSLEIKSFSLISDFWPHGDYAQILGIFREEDGFSERVNILIDENKKIIWIKIYSISELPDFEEIFDFLNKYIS
jgi:peroxiredoxin